MLNLNEFCNHLEITVHPFAMCSVREGEQLMLGPRNEATVHYVVAGSGTLSFPGYGDFDVSRGTTIIAPIGYLHEVSGLSNGDDISNMVHQCEPAAMGLTTFGEKLSDMESGIVLLCGTVDVTYRNLNDFYDNLRTPIVIQASKGDPITRAFDDILIEMKSPGPGTGAMLNALFLRCFIELLRREPSGSNNLIEWLKTVADPRLQKVIDEIIERPGNPYTLELLADKCAMSRTTFFERFHKAFSRSPMDFVREIRLRGAARLLKQSQSPIKCIASTMGYSSRSSFTHAFKEMYGVAPAEYRTNETGFESYQN